MYMIVGGIALLPIFLLAVYMIKKDRVFEGLWKLIGSFVCSPVILFAIAWTVVGTLAAGTCVRYLCLSIGLSVCLFVPLSVSRSVCLFVCLSVCPPFEWVSSLCIDRA